MKSLNPFCRQNVYVPAGSVVLVILAIGFACSFGCRRSSPAANAPKKNNLPATAAADSSPQQAFEKPTSDKPVPEPEASSSKKIVPAENGQQLYARHCAACHGERGDGKGLAATFLFPKPRDFRAGRFRLVSTNNNVPTREDLQAVLVRGMPGSAMPSWAHLTQQDRDALVDEIMRLRMEGARETVVNRLKEDEGMSDKEIAASAEAQRVIQDEIKNTTIAGEGRAVPSFGPPTEEAIAAERQTMRNSFASLVMVRLDAATACKKWLTTTKCPRNHATSHSACSKAIPTPRRSIGALRSECPGRRCRHPAQ